jgi:hypothetical protein
MWRAELRAAKPITFRPPPRTGLWQETRRSVGPTQQMPNTPPRSQPSMPNGVERSARNAGDRRNRTRSGTGTEGRDPAGHSSAAAIASFSRFAICAYRDAGLRGSSCSNIVPAAMHPHFLSPADAPGEEDAGDVVPGPAECRSRRQENPNLRKATSGLHGVRK